MTIILLSNFLGFIITQKLRIDYVITHNFKMPRLGKFKLFKCLTCFTFWLSIAISILFYFEYGYTLADCLLQIMASYLLSIFIDNR